MFNSHYVNGRLTLDIELTTFCNAKCPQCSRTDQFNALQPMSWLKLQQVSIDQFKSWFTKYDCNKIKNFHFSGTYGDPGMCKDLKKIVKYIIDNSEETTVSINTNGGMRDEDFWWDIGSIGRERIKLIFDVDGIDQEMHNKYRRGVDLATVLKHIEVACMTPAKVEVLTVLFKHNQNYLDDIQAMCYKLGVREFDSVEGNNFKEGPVYEFSNEFGLPETLEQITYTGPDREERRVRDHRHDEMANKYTNISCQAANRANMKVSSAGLLTPCCYLSTGLEWEISLRKGMATEQYLTVDGKYGGEKSQLVKEFIRRKDNFTLGNAPFSDIISDIWFNDLLKHSFKNKLDATYACKKVCGYVES
jgi:molybdenum cofactor biosynthesis enzyme MoaA